MTEEENLFIKEREEKLGSQIEYKTYSTWYASTFGEVRDHGVFIYSDGKTLVIEDFEVTPTILGIPIEGLKKRKGKYNKMELLIPVSSILEINTVTRSSAEKSFNNKKDFSKKANTFDKIFRKLATRVKLEDGSVIFLELLNRNEFKEKFLTFKEEENGSI